MGEQVRGRGSSEGVGSYGGHDGHAGRDGRDGRVGGRGEPTGGESDPQRPRYRIGDVARQLGLGQYTLKHYERSGLIEPQANPESGFRFYSCAEFGKLIIIRTLRRMGFTVEEVGDLLSHRHDPANVPAALERKIAENERRIRELEEANRLLKSRALAASRHIARGPLGTVEILPAFQFLGHFRNELLNDGVRGIAESQFWRESYERARIAVRIGAADYQEGAGDMWWGLILTEDELEEFRAVDPRNADGAPEQGKDSRLGEGTVRDEPSRAWLHVSLAVHRDDSVLASIKARLDPVLADRCLEVRGDVYAVMDMAKILEDKSMDMYMTALVPMPDEEG